MGTPKMLFTDDARKLIIKALEKKAAGTYCRCEKGFYCDCGFVSDTDMLQTLEGKGIDVAQALSD